MKYFITLITLTTTLLFGEASEFQASLDSAIFQLNNNEYTKSIDNFKYIIDTDSSAIFAQLGLLQANRFQMIEKDGYDFDKSPLFSQSDELVRFYEAKLEKKPNNPNLHFCLAMAVGFKLRAVLGEKNSFYILLNGLKAIKHIRICDELDNDNPDVEFAKGLFEYYISQYPGIVKYFSNLVLENTGDREVGRQRMHHAAQANGFMKADANYALAFMYLFVENDPEQALQFTTFLSDNYPDNSGFLFLSIFNYLQLDDLHMARKYFVQFQNSRQHNLGFYIHEFDKTTLFIEAMFTLKNNNSDLAKSKLIEFSTDYDLELEHLQAISYLELGKMQDLAGHRKEAIDYYNKAIDIDNRTYPIDLAKQFKQAPYQK